MAAGVQRVAIVIFRPIPEGTMNVRKLLAFAMEENTAKELFLMTLFSFLSNAGTVVPPIVSTYIFDSVIPDTLRSVLFVIVLILLCLDIARIGSFAVINISLSRVITKIGLVLEGGIWDRLLGMRLPFFSRYTTGEISQKLRSIDRLKSLLSAPTLRALVTSLFSFVNIIVLFRLDGEIALYTMLMFLALAAIYSVMAYRTFHLHRRYTVAENKVASFNQQALSSIQRIKASHAEERIFRIWSGLESEKRYLLGRIKVLENLKYAMALFFTIGATVVVFSLVFRKVDTGIGVFIAFTASFLLLMGEVENLQKALDILPEAASLCQNIAPILQGEYEYQAQKIIPPDITGSLEVNHLAFRYGEYGRIILNDISFRVEEEGALGIIGPSGCGKSTLLKALLGFYPLARGKVYFGGYDLETLELRYLRKRLGVVLQNGIIPLGTLFDIIRDNNNTISLNEVMDMLEKVGMAEAVSSLPAGINTPMENCHFSEGEKQRIMIARTLIQKHPFLFFDEPANCLDNTSAERIMEHIHRMRSTKLIVAQRLNTVKHCDRILVLGKSTVIENGTYDEIISSKNILKWLS
jgi:ABC-type bacteriocin/lantibiotic exporter with double-glycine peptidase domain